MNSDLKSMSRNISFLCHQGIQGRFDTPTQAALRKRRSSKPNSTNRDSSISRKNRHTHIALEPLCWTYIHTAKAPWNTVHCTPSTYVYMLARDISPRCRPSRHISLAEQFTPAPDFFSRRLKSMASRPAPRRVDNAHLPVKVTCHGGFCAP